MIIVAIKDPVIARSCSPPTLIVPGSTFMAPPKTLLGTWHDEYNMSLWRYCVPDILFVNGHHKVRANFWHDYWSNVLLYITGIKIDYKLLVSESS